MGHCISNRGCFVKRGLRNFDRPWPSQPSRAAPGVCLTSKDADRMPATRRGFQMPGDDESPARPRPESAPSAAGVRPPDSPAEEPQEFARMLEESLAPRFHQEGDTVEGRIVAVGPEVAFVDIGGKGEATIDIEELADPDSEVQVKVGDTVRAVVVS